MGLARRADVLIAAVAVLGGCSLVVSFDRDAIPDDLPDSASKDAFVPPTFDAADPVDASVTFDAPPTPVLTSSFLVAVGGVRDGLERADVFVAQIYSDGTLAPWSSAAPLPAPRLKVGLGVVGASIIVSGGAGDETVVKTTYVGELAGGTVSAWTESTSLPNELFRHGSFARNGRVYVVGGEDSLTPRSDVLVAMPSTTDGGGGIGAWSATQSLPAARTAAVVVASGDHLYVVSGAEAADGGVASIGSALAADFSSDGGVSGWRATTALPFVTNHAAGVATASHVIVAGGYGAPSSFRDVMVAPIGADGALGAWSASGLLNLGRAGHAMVLAGGHLYVIGGQEKSGRDATSVELADVAPDGTISAFRETAPLPSGRAFVEAALVDTSVP